MNRLLKIARTATPGTGIQFRKDKYGSSGIRSFLRDVLAMANAAVDGPRYIIIGVDFESRGRKAVHAVDVEDFSGKPSYQSLANELSDSQDRPYMMRIDFPGEIIHKDLSINSCDLSQLPSAEASKKLNQLIDI